MAEGKVLISELLEASTAADTDYMAIDNGEVTKKITVANYNASSNQTAASYASAAASSAQDASDTALVIEGKIADAQIQVDTATTAASNAANYRDAAQGYASDAQGYSNTASGYATNAGQSASSAEASASSADDYATLAKSWCQGNTGVRSGEDANNAMYWSLKAQTAAQLTIDDHLDEQSTNPVENGVITRAIDGIQTGGSNITITTSETSLRGRDVTITDGTTPYTEAFDENGVAKFEGVLIIGNLTVSSTNASSETATGTLYAPYYGKYSTDIAFATFTATLSFSTDNLQGKTITVKDSNESTVGTATFSNESTGTASVTVYAADTYSISCDGVTATQVVSAETTYPITLHKWTATLAISTTDADLAGETITIIKGGATVGTTEFPSSSPYSVDYPVHETGSYTASVTYSGSTYSDTHTVSSETTVDFEIETGLELSAWLTAGGLDPTDYADFSELEADEKAVRRLMTVHDAVDYIATCSNSTDTLVNQIISSNICAKWINLRDYALDTLYANTYVASMMDTADKYFYGEWVITDSTTNPVTWGAKGNVPVMTTNAAPYGTASAYQVFDKNSSTSASGTDFSYQFTSPVCVKKFDADIDGGTLQYSSDGGATWTDITTPSANTNYYLFYRVHYSSSQTVHIIQFYGREMKALIPIMTTITTPYGTVSSDSDYSTAYSAVHAFDGNLSTYGWMPAAFGKYVQYQNIHPMSGLYVAIYGHTTIDNMVFTIQGSNDGSSFTNIDNVTVVAANKWYLFKLPSVSTYKYYRFLLVSGNVGVTAGRGYDIQVYGVNYSEYEWDTDYPQHYIYDHGVELDTIEVKDSTTKENDCISIKSTTTTYYGLIVTSNSIDLSDYSIERVGVGNTMTGAVQIQASTQKTSYNSGRISYKSFEVSVSDLPDNLYLDISAVNQSAYPNIVAASNNKTIDVTEWWLE